MGQDRALSGEMSMGLRMITAPSLCSPANAGNEDGAVRTQTLGPWNTMSWWMVSMVP